jgi:predicted transcriptional regulator
MSVTALPEVLHMSTPATPLKQQAHALIDHLPDTATWDDVVYEMAVRRSIERGLADAEGGRLTDVEDVRREFGLFE